MNVLYLFTLLAVVNANRDELWQEWKRIHRKTYNDAHEHLRRIQWEKNVDDIQQHNLRYDLGLESYSMGLNQFADLSWDEFRMQYLTDSLQPPLEQDSLAVPFEPDLNSDDPGSVDWRAQGMVTPVKDQARCGSCWSFSTTGAMEGQYKKQFGELLSFSEQQLVDCSAPYGNHGCFGGLMERSYQYIKHEGLTTEDVYPYHARKQRCEYNRTTGRVRVTSYKTMHRGKENLLKQMTARDGPVAVAIHVTSGFQLYKSGVYVSDVCKSYRINHAVLVVGYGTEQGQDYWIVKNSWSPAWGEQGYIRMARNRGNMCGIATMASVPIIEKL